MTDIKCRYCIVVTALYFIQSQWFDHQMDARFL